MSYGTSAGTTISICTTATTAATQSTLAALTYVVINGVESLGDIGPEGQDVPLTLLVGDDTQHLKGSTDNGLLSMVLARDALDPGQIALIAAALTKLEYAFKIVENDGADANDTDTTTYIRGPVMGGRKSIGGANDITKRTYNIGINKYFEVASVAVP